MDKAILKQLVYDVNGAAIEVHKALGPGLLESIYHKCLMYELSLRKIPFTAEHEIPVIYKGISVKAELYCDLLIEDTLVVELKAVEKILPIHTAQILTYMKLLEAPMGLLLNFNVVNIFENGQKTYVNELFRGLILDNNPLNW